jgi:hypothetical protein
LKGWWKGISSKGNTGVFPSNFVVVVSNDSQTNKNELTSSDNELSADCVDGNKSSSLKKGDISETEKKPKAVKGVGFGDIFAGGIKPKLSPIDSSLDKNKLPKKPPPPTPASDSDTAPKLPPKPIREQAKVLFSYEAQNDDELTIKEGEIITIISKEIEDIGWWKGELNGRIALFPDNFVELIKSTPEEPVTTSRVKKPERPTEKPPPPLTTNQFKSSPLKLDSTKNSNKSFEELPKTSIGSNSSVVSSAPVIPGKKPKVLTSGILQQKPKSEPISTPISSSSKPDVVPQENGSKLDKDKDNDSNSKLNTTTNTSTTNAENHFSSIDSSGNKLTHLTAQRPKGPSSRRPPSTIFTPKESGNGNESKENGDISIVKSEVNVSNLAEQLNTKGSHTQPEKVEKLPPWMLELRKAQEKRKENPDESPKEPLSKPPLTSPIKTSPNRFSGDFANKSLQQTPTPDESEPTTPIQLLKPIKLTKPNANTNTSNLISSSVAPNAKDITTVDSQPIVASNLISNNISSNISSKTTNVVINSATSNTTSNIKVSKVDETIETSIDKKELSELKKEIRLLKENTISRKEFDALVKQVFN